MFELLYSLALAACMHVSPLNVDLQYLQACAPWGRSAQLKALYLIPNIYLLTLRR